MPQTPALQAWPAGHTVPQAPQLIESVCRLRQLITPPITQRVSVAAQASPHTPAAHAWVAGQTVPQAPQLLLSVCVLTQTLEPAGPHAVDPAAHAHTPAVHVAPL